MRPSTTPPVRLPPVHLSPSPSTPCRLLPFPPSSPLRTLNHFSSGRAQLVDETPPLRSQPVCHPCSQCAHNSVRNHSKAAESQTESDTETDRDRNRDRDRETGTRGQVALARFSVYLRRSTFFSFRFLLSGFSAPLPLTALQPSL